MPPITDRGHNHGFYNWPIIPPIWVKGGPLPINLRWRNGLGTDGKIIGTIVPKEFRESMQMFFKVHSQGRLLWELYENGLIADFETYQEPARMELALYGKLTPTGLAYRKVLAVKASIEINEFPRFPVDVTMAEFDRDDRSIMGMEAQANMRGMGGPAVNVRLDNLSEAQAAEIFRRLAGLPGMPSAEEFEDTTSPLAGLPEAFKRRLDLE